MKFLNFLKCKAAVASAAILGFLSVAHAEGESGESSVDVSLITEQVENTGNALLKGIKAMVNAIAPIAIDILVAAMVLGVIVLAIRWLFRIAKTSTK